MSKLKAFADNNLNASKMPIFVFIRGEKIVEQEENVWYLHCIFPQSFQKASFSESFNPLPDNTLLTLPNWKSCRRQIQIWRKWQKVIQMGRKSLWEKEELLVTSNFSFSHSVFKGLVSQGRQKVSLRGNGLTLNYVVKA